MSIPDPVVLLDARARYVHPAFQMTRASTKTVFDSAGRLVTVPPNALGWDHDPATGQARGYLAEPPATNLLLHSNDLTQGAWTTFNTTVTGDAATGPDGNGMAKIVENNSNAAHTVYQNVTIGDGNTIAASVVARAGERANFRLLVRQTSNSINAFWLDANLTGGGSVSNITSNGTAAGSDGGIDYLGGGLYRVWIVGALGAGITDARKVISLIGEGSTTYQGDGTSGLYLGYCQVEVGSYPTSYIETGAATATRAGDSLVLPDLGDFPWWRSERGTLVFDAQATTFADFGRLFQFSDSELFIRRAGPDNSNYLLGGDIVDGAAQLTDQAYSRNLVATSWDEEGVSVAVSGEVVAAQSLIRGLQTSPSLGVGCRSTGGVPFGGHINRAVYYPQRLSNADLQSLTAIQE